MPDTSVSGPAAGSAPPQRRQLLREAVSARDTTLCLRLVERWVHRCGLSSCLGELEALQSSLSAEEAAWLARVVSGQASGPAPAAGHGAFRPTAQEDSVDPVSARAISAGAPVTAAGPCLADGLEAAEAALREILGEGSSAQSAAERAAAAVDGALRELEESGGGVFSFPPPVQPRPEPLPFPDVLPNLTPPPVFHLGRAEASPQDDSGLHESGDIQAFGGTADEPEEPSAEPPTRIPDAGGSAGAPLPASRSRRLAGWLERRGVVAWLKGERLGQTHSEHTCGDAEEPGGQLRSDPVVAEPHGQESGLPAAPARSGLPLAAAASTATAPEEPDFAEGPLADSPPQPAAVRRRLTDLQAVAAARQGHIPAPGPADLADLRSWLPDRELPRAS